MDPKFLTHHLNILFAARYYAYKSKDPKDIADALCVKPRKVESWMKSYKWLEALDYWGQKPKQGDFNDAERLWEQTIENGEHLFPVDYPNKPIRMKHSENVFATSALINPHLFCADNLSDEEIRARLAEERKFEGEPVRYEGQRLGNIYCWWLYPNWDEGLYSKAFARINVVGDLVVGTGEDTSLVIIRHGRLTLARQFSDDVANASDERLLICL